MKDTLEQAYYGIKDPSSKINPSIVRKKEGRKNKKKGREHRAGCLAQCGGESSGAPQVITSLSSVFPHHFGIKMEPTEEAILSFVNFTSTTRDQATAFLKVYPLFYYLWLS